MSDGYNNAAERDVDLLLNALSDYGQHLEGCPLHWASSSDEDPQCECGLNEILEEHGREGVG